MKKTVLATMVALAAMATAPVPPAAVPLPGAGLLLAGGLAAFALVRRRKVA